MSLSAIVAPLDGPRLALARSRASVERTEAENYAVYRSIIDAYEEVQRPSIADVRAGAYAVGAVVDGKRGQDDDYSLADAGKGHVWVQKRQKVFVPFVRPREIETAQILKQAPIFMRGRDVAEGRSLRFVLAPGMCGTRQIDTNKAEKTRDRQNESARRQVDMLNAMRADLVTGEILDEAPDFTGSPKSEITDWSAKSRSNMTKTIASLDYTEWEQADGALAMVTLTLPGDWQAVAPTGKRFKKLVENFRLRWRDAGMTWRCLWKLEFQRRGAPHMHLLMRVPALVNGEIFETWLSRNWASVVGASKVVDREDGSSEYSRHLAAGTGVDFSGQDFSDPTRISMYFAGHSAKTTDGKEYQHIVPEEWQAPGAGPGRFWGFSGLKKAVVEVDMPQKDYDRTQRIMRHVAKARAWRVAVLRERGRWIREGKDLAGFKPSQVRGKKIRRSQFGGGGGFNGGWCLMNDPIAFAFDLSRYLES